MGFASKLKSFLQGKLLGNYRLAVRNGMKVGRRVSVMGGVNFGSEPYLITLEDEVRISTNVTFVNHDGGTWAFRDKPEYSDVIKFGRIRVGERTFIGCNSTILPGVTIGKRCVIGAGSLVNKDIPDGCVAAGVPAQIITTTQEYAEKCKSAMGNYDIEAYRRNKKEYLLNWLRERE